MVINDMNKNKFHCAFVTGVSAFFGALRAEYLLDPLQSFRLEKDLRICLWASLFEGEN